MKLATLALSAALALPALALAQVADPAYAKKVTDWRAKVEKSLRADNGWLTLAGRYVLKPGENTFGNGPGNDIVFPKGVGSPGMGSAFVDYYCRIKEAEVERFGLANKDAADDREVSEWEHREYFDLL